MVLAVLRFQAFPAAPELQEALELQGDREPRAALKGPEARAVQVAPEGLAGRGGLAPASSTAAQAVPEGLAGRVALAVLAAPVPSQSPGPGR